MLSISLAIILVYLICLIFWGYDFCVFNHMMGQVSVDLEIPYWIIYLCVPIAMSIASYQVLLKIDQDPRVPADEFSYDMVMKEH